MEMGQTKSPGMPARGSKVPLRDTFLPLGMVGLGAPNSLNAVFINLFSMLQPVLGLGGVTVQKSPRNRAVEMQDFWPF
jgi:hypothetical protein